MANSNELPNVIYDGGTSFFRGVNSYFHPEDLPSNQIAWLINGIMDRGQIRTRPDYDTLLRVPDGRAQGMALFTPTNGIPSLVFAVSGKVYLSQYPFDSYSQLNNIQFDPYVDFVVFKEAIQAVVNGVLVTPRTVLIMQDGLTRPAYYDGTVNRHLNPGGSTNETPVGLWMEFVGGRLWVSRERQIFASDIYDPLTFTETTYVAGGQSLQTPDGDIITGLKRTADTKSLLAFTIKNTALILAGITDRTQWAVTPNFVSTLFPGVGCCAGKSFAENNGALWWFSLEGARTFTQVAAQIQTSHSAVSSQEMSRSYNNLSPTMSRICAFGFQSHIGFSVPSGDVYNHHTWILDNAVADLISSQYPAAWNGAWLGTRPVEWATGFINGENRCFYLSQDTCGVRIWEAYAGDTGTDNGGKIFVSAELNGMKFNEEISLKKYMFTEYYLAGVFGEIPFSSEYRSEWGCWRFNAQLNLCSERCIPGPECDPHTGTYFPSSRLIRTENTVIDFPENATDMPYGSNIGSFFQNRVRWYGKSGLNKFKGFSDQFEESNVGVPDVTKSDELCKKFICCDQEVAYVSHVHDGGYGYGSSTPTPSCSL